VLLRLEHGPGEAPDPTRLYKALTKILQAGGCSPADLQKAAGDALGLSKARLLATSSQLRDPNLAKQATAIVDWYAKHVLPAMLDRVGAVLLAGVEDA